MRNAVARIQRRRLARTESHDRRPRPPDWPAIHRERRRPHVTKLLVWQEYLEHEPDGYQYSQFCARCGKRQYKARTSDFER